MKRSTAVVCSLAVWVLLGPLAVPSFAKDYCINDGLTTWIGRSFAVPGRNRCRPWNGFVKALAPPGGGREICSGTACTSAGGDEMRLTMTCASTYATAMKLVTFSIDPALGTGTRYEAQPDIGPPGGPQSSTGPVTVLCLTSYTVP